MIFLILCFLNYPQWHPSIIKWICLHILLPQKKNKTEKSRNLYWDLIFAATWWRARVIIYLSLVTAPFFLRDCALKKCTVFRNVQSPSPPSPNLQVAALSPWECEKLPHPFWVPASGNLRHKVKFTRQFFPVPHFPLHFLFIVMLPCTYESNVYFQCRVFINGGCTKQEKVLRMLISCHLPQTCPFLSSLCHSLSVLCRAAYPFPVVFCSFADGRYCLLSHFPGLVLFSLSPATFLLLLWICMCNLLFQISALPSLFPLLRFSVGFWFFPYFLECISPSWQNAAFCHLHPFAPRCIWWCCSVAFPPILPSEPLFTRSPPCPWAPATSSQPGAYHRVGCSPAVVPSNAPQL